MRWAALAFVAVVLTHPAAASEQYVCVGSATTGFSWDGSAWSATKFKPSNYLIAQYSEPKGETKTEGQVSKIGEKHPYMFCHGFSGINIKCRGAAGQLTLNRDTLRFLYLYDYGYFDGVDSDANTPAVSIGVCSKV